MPSFLAGKTRQILGFRVPIAIPTCGHGLTFAVAATGEKQFPEIHDFQVVILVHSCSLEIAPSFPAPGNRAARSRWPAVCFELRRICDPLLSEMSTPIVPLFV
jgi:hypothetical protein